MKWFKFMAYRKVRQTVRRPGHRIKRLVSLTLSLVLVLGSLVPMPMAASLSDLPVISPARLGVIDSRTYTRYLESEHLYQKLRPLLKQELAAIKLTEVNVKTGLSFTDYQRKAIDQVFGKFDSTDPLGDFYRIRQYDAAQKAYDAEGKLYLLDDLAALYTYGLVDFKLAQRYNRKAEALYRQLERMGLGGVPVSDYFNGRRSLYHTFFYRLSKNSPHDYRIFPGRIDWITPFEEKYLADVRKLDFRKIGRRIRDRQDFIAATLGDRPPAQTPAAAPSAAGYRSDLMACLELFMGGHRPL